MSLLDLFGVVWAVAFGSFLGVSGALWVLGWWPRTRRWPELERYCAVLIDEWEGGAPPVDLDMERLRELVRPHVLERARR